jgi:hypothetical protein
MAGHGPVEFVVVGFTGGRIDESLGPALREQVDRGAIRIIDLLFVRKDPDGNQFTFELEDVSDDDAYSHLYGVPGEIDGLVAEEDVAEFVDELPPGTTAMIVLFEHMWLRDLRVAIEASGGQVMFTERIAGEVVDEVESAVLALAADEQAALSAEARAAQGADERAARAAG